MDKLNKSNRRNAGFTLIEVLLASILIGMAIAALAVSSRAFTMANGSGINLSTSEFLMEEIRALTAFLPVVDPNAGTTIFGPEEASLADYDDLDDFDGVSFSPPIDINRAQLNNFTQFSQQVTVENVSSSNFATVVSDHGSPFVRVTVTIFLNNGQINSANWIRARY